MISTGNSKLHGLVLAGGKSSRMGEDKGKICWHQKEQRYHIADILKKVCDEVYISCRPEQVPEIATGYKTIADEIPGRGPLGAILSAFHSNDHVAWLVVACDLPLLDFNTITYLLEKRNTNVSATTFRSPYDELPEPLITIWESRSLPLIEKAIAGGLTCPRKVLMNIDIEIVDAPDKSILINANTITEKEQVFEILTKDEPKPTAHHL